jgi:hypothetical protein
MTLRDLQRCALLLVLAACGPGPGAGTEAGSDASAGAVAAGRSDDVQRVEVSGAAGGGQIPFGVQRPGARTPDRRLTSPESAARAAGAEDAAARASGEGALLVFDELALDLGAAWEGEPVEARYRFRNAGAAALQIGEIKPSCGCTTTALARTRYEPGESGELELVWEPKGFGPQTKTIFVSSNSTGSEHVVLRVSARIQQFAHFSPQPLRLGDLERGEEHTAQVVLACVDPEFELLALTSQVPGVSARESGRGPDGSREITLTIANSAPWGSLAGAVQARVRGRRPGEEQPVERTAEVFLAAMLVGDLRLDPIFFAVGRVEPRGRVDYTVRLTSRSGTPFRVVSARVERSQPPGLGVHSRPSPQGGVDLVLEGDVGDYLGLIRAEVVFETDLVGEQERRLAVQGIVR